MCSEYKRKCLKIKILSHALHTALLTAQWLDRGFICVGAVNFTWVGYCVMPHANRIPTQITYSELERTLYCYADYGYNTAAATTLSLKTQIRSVRKPVLLSFIQQN